MKEPSLPVVNLRNIGPISQLRNLRDLLRRKPDVSLTHSPACLHVLQDVDESAHCEGGFHVLEVVQSGLHGRDLLQKRHHS